MPTNAFDQRHQNVSHQVNMDPVGPISTTPAKPHVSPGSPADLDHRFTYHPPKPGQAERYTALRAKALELALLISSSTPSSREQALALTRLEEAVSWSSASIARNET